MKQLVLHCGAERVSFNDVMEADRNLPDATRTYRPVRHAKVRTMVMDHLDHLGFEVERESFGLTAGGDKFFSVLEMRDRITEECGLLVGLRNSHNKSMRAGICAGKRVFVCDNMCFSGDIAILRKHTPNIIRDLEDMLAAELPKLEQFKKNAAEQIERSKDFPIDGESVSDFLVRAGQLGVIPSGHILKVMSEWERPSHEEFLPRTMWSLENAFTSVLKNRNPQDLYDRSMKLTGMIANRMLPVRPLEMN